MARKEAGIKMSNFNIPFSTYGAHIKSTRYGILQDANSELPPSDKDSFFLDKMVEQAMEYHRYKALFLISDSVYIPEWLYEQ
jgi:hypothetical protein